MATKPSRNKKDYNYQDLDSVDPEIVVDMFNELRKKYVFVRGSSKAQVFWSYVDPTWALGKGVIARKEDAPKKTIKVKKQLRRRVSRDEMERRAARKEGYTEERKIRLGSFDVKKESRCITCFEPCQKNWKAQGMCRACYDYRRTWTLTQAVDYLATHFAFAERFTTTDVPSQLIVSAGANNAQLTYTLRSNDMVCYEKREDGTYDHWIVNGREN